MRHELLPHEEGSNEYVIPPERCGVITNWTLLDTGKALLADLKFGDPIPIVHLGHQTPENMESMQIWLKNWITLELSQRERASCRGCA